MDKPDTFITSFDLEEPEPQVIEQANNELRDSMTTDELNNNNNNNNNDVVNTNGQVSITDAQRSVPSGVQTESFGNISNERDQGSLGNKRKHHDITKTPEQSEQEMSMDLEDPNELDQDYEGVFDAVNGDDPFGTGFDLPENDQEQVHDDYSKSVAKLLAAALLIDASARSTTLDMNIDVLGELFGEHTEFTKWKLVQYKNAIKILMTASSKIGTGIASPAQLKAALLKYPNALRDADYINSRAAKVKINSILLFNPFSALLYLLSLEDAVQVVDDGLKEKGSALGSCIIRWKDIEKLFYSVQVQEELFGDQKIDITTFCNFFTRNLNLQRNLFQNSLMRHKIGYVDFFIYRVAEFLNVKQTFNIDEINKDEKQISTFGPHIRLIGEGIEIMTHDFKVNEFGNLIKNQQLTPDVIFGKIFQILTSKLQDMEIEGSLGSFGRDALVLILMSQFSEEQVLQHLSESDALSKQIARILKQIIEKDQNYKNQEKTVKKEIKQDVIDLIRGLGRRYKEIQLGRYYSSMVMLVRVSIFFKRVMETRNWKTVPMYEKEYQNIVKSFQFKTEFLRHLQQRYDTGSNHSAGNFSELADYTGKKKEELVALKILFTQGFGMKTLVFTSSNNQIIFDQYQNVHQKFVQNKEPQANQPDHFKNTQIQLKFANILALTDPGEVNKNGEKLSNYDQIFFVGGLGCNGILDTVSNYFDYYKDGGFKNKPDLVLILNNYELSRHSNFKPNSSASFTNQKIYLKQFVARSKSTRQDENGNNRTVEHFYHPNFFGVTALKFFKEGVDRRRVEELNAITYSQVLQKHSVNLMQSTNYLSQVPNMSGPIASLALKNKIFYGNQTKAPESSRDSCELYLNNVKHTFTIQKDNYVVIDRIREREVLTKYYFTRKVEDLKDSFHMKNDLGKYKIEHKKAGNKNIDDYFEFTEDDLEL